MSAARIGKIRMKAGGAVVRVIGRSEKDPDGYRGKIIHHARLIAGFDQDKSELVGFVVIGMFSDGAHSVGFRWNPNKTPIPRRMMPSYLAEIVREEMITLWETRDIAT